MLYFALFIAFLGFFQGDHRITVFGAVLAGASFFVNVPDVMEAIGFDGERIQDTMSGGSN